MSLKQQLAEEIKSALRARDRERLSVLRMLWSAVKQKEIDERSELGDDGVLAVVEKMIKQRRDSEKQYRDAGRAELADAESAEIVVLKSYLPEPLSDAELAELIDAAVAETGAESMRDMGKVMGVLKPKAQGRADMGAVSAKIKAKLGG
jgi:hypothetical protein